MTDTTRKLATLVALDVAAPGLALQAAQLLLGGLDAAHPVWTAAVPACEALLEPRHYADFLAPDADSLCPYGAEISAGVLTATAECELPGLAGVAEATTPGVGARPPPGRGGGR